MLRTTMRAGSTAIAVLLAGLIALMLGAHLAVGAVSDRVLSELDAAAPHMTVIVPGAGLRPDGSPHGLLTERLVCAQHLLEAGRVRDVLVSGDGASPDHDETTAMQRWLVERGVPAASIRMDFAGFRTRDTMQRAARVFAVHDAVICTQGMHANRAVYLALDAGIDAVAVVAIGDDWFGVDAWLRERFATLVAVFETVVAPATGVALANLTRVAPN